MRCSDTSKACAIVLAASLLGAVPAYGEHLGVIGPVHEIDEPDLLATITAKLEAADHSGEIRRRQLAARERIVRTLESPPAIERLTRTRKPRTFHFDPTLTVTEPIVDRDGTVIAAPGTRLNPLDTVSLSRSLLFFDSRDTTQLALAERLRTEQGSRLKLILIGGAPLTLMRRWKQPVYFDQRGSLSERLGLRHVPALVSQEGRRLRIDEIR